MGRPVVYTATLTTRWSVNPVVVLFKSPGPRSHARFFRTSQGPPNPSTVAPNLVQTQNDIYAAMPVHIPRNPPLPDTFHARARGELRALVFQPIQRNRGTNYPCTESELRDATTPSHQPRTTVSAHQASQEVLAYNALGRNLSRREYNTICRLEDVVLGVFANRIAWTPDLIIKAFCDIDVVFFLGRLRGHVYVQWRSASSFPPPSRHRLYYGRTDYLGGGKAVIRLNADGIFASTRLSTFKEMWRTMLHEMW